MIPKCAGILVAFVTLVGCNRGTDDASSAYYVSEKFVRSKLIAPTTARFPNQYIERDSCGVYGTNGRYTAWGYVDSENVFGAKVRQKWVTAVQSLGDNKWQLKYLKLGDKEGGDLEFYQSVRKRY